jgi:hypothetical protein
MKIRASFPIIFYSPFIKANTIVAKGSSKGSKRAVPISLVPVPTVAPTTTFAPSISDASSDVPSDVPSSLPTSSPICFGSRKDSRKGKVEEPTGNSQDSSKGKGKSKSGGKGTKCQMVECNEYNGTDGDANSGYDKGVTGTDSFESVNSSCSNLDGLVALAVAEVAFAIVAVI